MSDNNPWDDEHKKNTKNDFFENKTEGFIKNLKEKHMKKIGRPVALICTIVAVLFLLSGLFKVEHDQRGVILRFGKWVRTVGPGLQYKLPYPLERVILCRVTSVNQVDIGYSADKNSENLVLTGDSNLASFSYSVLWKIKEENVEDFLFNAKCPEVTVIAVAQSVMREIIGQSDFAFVQTEGRAVIQKKALESIQAIMNEYKLGVEIVKISLQRVEPPASVIDSFRDVERAQADQQSECNKAEAYSRDTRARTRGIIAMKVNRAEAERSRIIAEAQGTSEKFNLVYLTYKTNPEIIATNMTLDMYNEIYANSKKLIIDPDVKSLQHMSIPQSYLQPILQSKEGSGEKL